MSPRRPMAAAVAQVGEGASALLGATPAEDGVNFSVFSRDATGVDLLLFDHVDDARSVVVLFATEHRHAGR